MLTVSATFDGKRTIPSARVTDIILELLDLNATDKVLEIGTGSGYQTQRLADTQCELHTIELEPWIDSTKITGDYVFLHSGDGRLGVPEAAPFTVVVATCGVEQIPDEWVKQLDNGGRLVVPIGDSKVQRLTLFRKDKLELVPVRIAAYTRFQMLRDKPKPGKPKYEGN